MSTTDRESREAAAVESAMKARRAAEKAASNIRRYLRAQRAAATQVIILKPELVEAAEETALAAELAAVNIKRFLRLQRESVTRVTPIKRRPASEE